MSNYNFKQLIIDGSLEWYNEGEAFHVMNVSYSPTQGWTDEYNLQFEDEGILFELFSKGLMNVSPDTIESLDCMNIYSDHTAEMVINQIMDENIQELEGDQYSKVYNELLKLYNERFYKDISANIDKKHLSELGILELQAIDEYIQSLVDEYLNPPTLFLEWLKDNDINLENFVKKVIDTK